MCIYTYVRACSMYTILHIYSFNRFCTVMYFTLYSIQDTIMTNGNSIFHLTLLFFLNTYIMIISEMHLKYPIVPNSIHCIRVKWPFLFDFAPRGARFLSDGHHQKP